MDLTMIWAGITSLTTIGGLVAAVKNYLDMQLSEKQRKEAEAEGDKILSIAKTSTAALQDVTTKVASSTGSAAVKDAGTIAGDLSKAVTDVEGLWNSPYEAATDMAIIANDVGHVAKDAVRLVDDAKKEVKAEVAKLEGKTAVVAAPVAAPAAAQVPAVTAPVTAQPAASTTAPAPAKA